MTYPERPDWQMPTSEPRLDQIVVESHLSIEVNVPPDLAEDFTVSLHQIETFAEDLIEASRHLVYAGVVEHLWEWLPERERTRFQLGNN